MENSTVQSNPSPWPIALKYGIIGGVFPILTSLIQYLTGMMDIDKLMESGGSSSLASSLGGFGLAILNIVIYTVIYWLAVKAYRTKLGGFITFGKGFKVSFFSVLVKALMIFGWNIILFGLIIPEYTEGMLNMMGEIMQQSSNGDEDVFEMLMNMCGYIFNPFGMSLIAAIGTIIGGTLLSLLAAAIGQKE